MVGSEFTIRARLYEYSFSVAVGYKHRANPPPTPLPQPLILLSVAGRPKCRKHPKNWGPSKYTSQSQAHPQHNPTPPDLYSIAAACPWPRVCRSLVDACVSSGAYEGEIERHPLLATQAFSVLEGVLTVSSEQQAGAARLHMVRRFSPLVWR